jgi:hypothetical protein
MGFKKITWPHSERFNNFWFVPPEDYEIYKDFYKFGFVRNPWARLVSCYIDKFNKNGKLTYKGFRKYHWPLPMQFPEFIRTICKIPEEEMEGHFKPQYLKIDPERLDFLGHVETIKEDWAEVRKACPYLPALGHHKKTNHAPFESFYTPELRDLVGEKYKMDIKLFGYKPPIG